MEQDTRHIIVQFVGKLCAVFRALILVTTLAIAVMIMVVGQFLLGGNTKFRFWMKKIWCRWALIVLGVRLTVRGNTKQESPYLCISNHVNFIDPWFFLAYLDVRPVGKHEIENYPLIGFTGKAIGMLFVNRESGSSRSAIKNTIESNLKEGDNILIFPEGTISHKNEILPFKRGSFAAAENAGVPVLCCTLKYEDEDRYRWYDRSLISQFFYQASFWKTKVTLSIHDRFEITDLKQDIKYIQKVIEKKVLE